MSNLAGLFIMFARIGAFSFGGGYAMLPLIFQSVQQFGYMSSEEFSNLVALSQVTPGPVAVNAATYVGFLTGGVLGATSSTLGVGLPCFVFILIVSTFINKFKQSRIMEGAFKGIRPVTVGLIASAAYVLSKTAIVIGGAIEPVPLAIFVVSLVLAWKIKLSPIIITLIMGAVGAFLC